MDEEEIDRILAQNMQLDVENEELYEKTKRLFYHAGRLVGALLIAAARDHRAKHGVSGSPYPTLETCSFQECAYTRQILEDFDHDMKKLLGQSVVDLKAIFEEMSN